MSSPTELFLTLPLIQEFIIPAHTFHFFSSFLNSYILILCIIFYVIKTFKN